MGMKISKKHNKITISGIPYELEESLYREIADTIDFYEKLISKKT